MVANGGACADESEGPMTWESFIKTFREYFLETVRKHKEVEFLELVQRSLYVAQYEAKFTELAFFASHMMEDDARKAYKFEQGLKPSLHSNLFALMIRSYKSIVTRAILVKNDHEEFQSPREQQKKHPHPQDF